LEPQHPKALEDVPLIYLQGLIEEFLSINAITRFLSGMADIAPNVVVARATTSSFN
jgi:hypothetical protein